MTQTTAATVGSPRLERPKEGAVVGGVCAALARTTGTDPVLWRVTLAVLTVFGGLGLLLYVLGWVLIPEEDQAQSLVDRMLHGPDRQLTHRQVLLLVAALVLATGVIGGWYDLLLPAVVLGGLAFLVHRRRGQPGVAAPVPPATSAAPTFPSYDVPAKAPRPQSVLGGLVASTTVLVTGLLVLLANLGVDGITAPRVLAADLAVVGLGLVVGTWWGRSRGLVALALVLALALGGAVAARDTLADGVGERTWRPAAAGSYHLGLGEATLDLAGLPLRDPADPVSISAEVRIGHLVVLVPEGLRVSVTARSDLGDVLIDGHDVSGTKVRDTRFVGPVGAPQVMLDLRVRTGQVEVRRG